MKRIWMIVSALAIANLLALAAVLGWLHSSNRLNHNRVEQIRTMLSTTVAHEQAEKAEAEAAAEQAQKQAAEDARQAVPPETAAERIAAAQLKTEVQLQGVLRQKQELENLRSGLMRQLADLEQRERRLADARTAFDAERMRIAESEGTQQFKAALSTLESQKARDAKLILSSLLAESQHDQVVAYLSKMDEGKRSKIIAEFVKDNVGVAADLLERLRTRGLMPPESAGTAPGAASNGPTLADNSADRAAR